MLVCVELLGQTNACINPCINFFHVKSQVKGEYMFMIWSLPERELTERHARAERAAQYSCHFFVISQSIPLKDLIYLRAVSICVAALNRVPVIGEVQSTVL